MISLDGAMHALISLVGYALAFYYLFQVTWMAYIAIMSLRNLLPKLHPVSRFNAYVMLFTIGYPLDLLFNLFASLVIFQWRPMGWLFTGTLKYWIASDDERRAATAAWICEHKLDPFDPGHCE